MSKSWQLKINSPKAKNAEDMALSFLKKQGFSLIECNYACQFGELDLIMIKKNLMLFVEVRLRKLSQYGDAKGSITLTKQKRIIKTAEFFLWQNQDYKHLEYRFDVIAIDIDQQTMQLSWVKNAINFL